MKGEPRDPRYRPDNCNTFWGSHGCDLPYGHDGPCICGSRDPDGLCTQYEPGVGVRFYHLGDELYGFGGAWGDNALPQPPLPTDTPPRPEGSDHA